MSSSSNNVICAMRRCIRSTRATLPSALAMFRAPMIRLLAIWMLKTALMARRKRATFAISVAVKPSWNAFEL